MILHAWNWSFSQIMSELPNIAEAGYTAIQTFEYIHDDETVVLQDFSSKTSVKFELEDEGTYKFVVYVTDEAGTVVSKTIKKYKVKTRPLSMTEFKANKLNAVVAGGTVKLTADSEGGSGVVKYKFTYKSIVSIKSTVIKG